MNASEKVLNELNEREAKRLEEKRKNVLEKTIVEGVFTMYHGTTKDEFALMNGLLDGVNLEDKDSLFSITDKVLSLPLNERLHFIGCVMDHHYSLSEDTKTINNVLAFLSQPCFDECGVIIRALLDDDIEYYKNKAGKVKTRSLNLKAGKIINLEEKFGIKLVFDDERLFNSDGEEYIY